MKRFVCFVDMSGDGYVPSTDERVYLIKASTLDEAKEKVLKELGYWDDEDTLEDLWKMLECYPYVEIKEFTDDLDAEIVEIFCLQL